MAAWKVRSIVYAAGRRDKEHVVSPNYIQDPIDEDFVPYEYILKTDRSKDLSVLGVSLSNSSIKLFDRDNLMFKGEIVGHSGGGIGGGGVADFCFSKTNAAILYSCARDGVIRGFDYRIQSIYTLNNDKNAPSQSSSSGGGRVLQFTVPPADQVECMAIGLNDTLCCTAGESGRLAFWDLRHPGKECGEYVDVHSDLITKVIFHPTVPTVLASASDDGLICLFDTGVSSQEEAMKSVMNAESAVQDIGFFGDGYNGLYSIMGPEFSIWHCPSAQRIRDFGDIRARGDGWGVTVDYLVSCHYSEQDDRLSLMVGDHDGQGVIVEVAPDDLIPCDRLSSGHTEQIRSVDWGSDSVITGSEDGKLCSWFRAQTDGSGSSNNGSGAMPATLGAAAPTAVGKAQMSKSQRKKERRRENATPYSHKAAHR